MSSENGDSVVSNTKKDEIETAVAAADPYHGRGTTYLHTPSPPSADGGDGSSSGNSSSENPTGAVVVPITLSTTFKQSTPGIPSAKDDPNSFGLGYEYARTGNPTRGAFERAIATSESATHCVAYSSGSAATSAILHLLSPGDNVLCVDDVYGGTQRYFRKVVNPRMNITFDFVNFDNESDVKAKLDGGKKKTKLIWLETPTNPTLRITDITYVSTLAKQYNCYLCVDNTFCSPYFQTPLALGADIVIHSVTKYIGGHSDVVCGVVCCNDDTIYKELKFIQNGVGAVPSPFDCFLAHRGLKTLHVRMEAAARNAHAIALFLESHKAVTKVLYPGLKSHPQHELVLRQQHGFGAMITFYCIGGREQSALVLQNLRIFALAESLGAVESLAECPSLMTHASVPPEQRQILGIDDTLIRLSVGIESCQDLMDDLEKGLNAALKSL